MSSLGTGQAYRALAFVGVIAASACDGAHGDGAGTVAGAAGDASSSQSGGTQSSQAGGGAAGSETPPNSAFCEADKDCPTNKLCDVNLRICVDCLASSNCGENQDCKQGQCVAFTSCDSTRDCPDEAVCDKLIQRCVECAGDNDCCAAGSACTSVCVDNECRQKCVNDQDCGTDAVCDTSAGQCVQCVTRDDCKEREYCDQQRCKAEVCKPDSAVCKDDSVVRCNAEGSGFMPPIECSKPETCVQNANQAACTNHGAAGMSGTSGGGTGGTGGTSATGGTAGTGGTNAGGAGSGGAGSGGTGAGGQGGSNPVSCTNARQIDDMEDGDTNACRFKWSSFVADGDSVSFSSSDTTGSHQGSRKALLISINVDSDGADYAGVGTQLAKKPNVFNASMYRGIEFWAKAFSFSNYELEVSVDMAPNYTDAGFQANRDITPSWRYYFISFTEFAGDLGDDAFDPAKMTLIEFWGREDGEVWVDDIAFVPK